MLLWTRHDEEPEEEQALQAERHVLGYLATALWGLALVVVVYLWLTS